MNATRVKVLVVGASGQLARSLLAADLVQAFDVLSASRPLTDLTKPETITKALTDHRPQFVINAAAYTQVDNAETQSAEAFAVNAQGVRHLANTCAARNIPLIHVSTDYVYDGKKAEVYDETDATDPVGVYGKSKLAGEEAIREAGGPHVILRTAWVYSPYGNNFVKTMLRLAKANDKLRVVNDQHGCPTYAPHLAEGIIRIIEKLEHAQSVDELWGTYCMAGGGETSWHDFACEIFSQSQNLGGPSAKLTPIPTADYPTSAQRPENSCLNCDKLERSFGIRLPHWKQGTASCVARLCS